MESSWNYCSGSSRTSQSVGPCLDTMLAIAGDLRSTEDATQCRVLARVKLHSSAGEWRVRACFTPELDAV
jgi:hypothetical protein